MSLYASATSAQRQQILSRVSSFKFDSSYAASSSPPPTAAATLFSPLPYKPSFKQTAKKRHKQSAGTERQTPSTSLEGMTQTFSMTHLRPKTPLSYRQPGECIGRLGTRRSLEETVPRDKKKRQKMQHGSTPPPWIKQNHRRLISGKSSSMRNDPTTTSLGDIYDYQLNRLAMKSTDRPRSPVNDNNLRTKGKDTDNLTEMIPFFTPIRCHSFKETKKNDDSNDHPYDDNILLTPVEINFDEDFHHDRVCTTETIPATKEDEDKAPLAAFAREFLNP